MAHGMTSMREGAAEGRPECFDVIPRTVRCGPRYRAITIALSCVFAAMREELAQENILPEVLHELMSAFDDAPGCSIDSIDHGFTVAVYIK